MDGGLRQVMHPSSVFQHSVYGHIPSRSGQNWHRIGQCRFSHESVVQASWGPLPTFVKVMTSGSQSATVIVATMSSDGNLLISGTATLLLRL